MPGCRLAQGGPPPVFLSLGARVREPILSEECVIYLTKLDQLAHLSICQKHVPAELCGMSRGPIQVLDGSCWKGHERPLRQDLKRTFHSAGSGRSDVALGFN
jgi:hypothetical protein